MESYSTALCVWALALGVLVAAPSGRGQEHVMKASAYLKWADVPALVQGIGIGVIEADEPRKQP